MKRLLASTALAMALAVPATAQSTDQAAEGNAFMGQADASALHASNLIGSRLYTSENEVGDDAAGLDENWEDVGEIGDIVFGKDGSVDAILVDVGGFLGIGEKRVAVSMDQLDFVQEDGGDSYFIVVQASRDQLENAPEFGADAEATDDAAMDGEDSMSSAEGEGDAAMTDGEDSMAAAEGEADAEMTDGEDSMASAEADADAEAGTDDTSEEVAEAADAAGDDMEQTAENAGEMAEDAGEDMEQAAENTGEAIENTAEEAGDEMAEAADATENAAEEAGDEMAQAADEAGDEVEEAANEADQEMDEAAQEAENATDEAAEETEMAADEATDEESMENADAAESAEDDGSTEMAAADDNAMAAPEVEREGYSSSNFEELSTEDVTGARVYDVNDEWIGEVSELLMTEDGKVDAAIIDVGGFLGLGEKPVKMSIDSLNIQRPDEGGSVRIYIGASEDELKGMPEYDAG